jgi:hypothetical protein
MEKHSAIDTLGRIHCIWEIWLTAKIEILKTPPISYDIWDINIEWVTTITKIPVMQIQYIVIVATWGALLVEQRYLYNKRWAVCSNYMSCK